MNENHQPISCVGFIMDGNRRYAKERGEQTLRGHLAGKEKFTEVVDWILEAKIPHAVFYAFSTENWQRSPEEVKYLVDLLATNYDESKANVKLKIIGDLSRFPKALEEKFRKYESETADRSHQTTIWVALSYGGRAEIIEAVNKAVATGEVVTEKDFSKLLFTSDMPDPDLIIRTGGEQRLSNFLPWQSVYSELFFTSTYWPAFTKAEFQRILSAYAKRDRRHGR